MSDRTDYSLKIGSLLLKYVSALLGLVAAYFLTIQSLRLDLAVKADDATVDMLDKKLTNIEVIIKEGMLSRDQFYTFSSRVESRLARIESLLEQKTGEKLGEN